MPTIYASALVLDFDGVLTDNNVYIDQLGRESVRCNKWDSVGIELLRRARVPMVVVTHERNAVVAQRCRKLRIGCIVANSFNTPKSALVRSWMVNKGLTDRVVFVGNDINDLDCMTMDGVFGVAVEDAHEDVKHMASCITIAKGGCGAVREVCEGILKGKIPWTIT